MKITKIPKGNGKFRTIYVPNREEKQIFYNHLPKLARKAKQQAGSHSHGFIKGRSIVTAAENHVGHKWTLTTDLKDFFDSCTEQMLTKILTKEQLADVLIDGAPRQGLPTSPSVANLAATNLDKAILKTIEKKQIIYTRYADDLTFSGDTEEDLTWLQQNIKSIVNRTGFKLSEEKTHIYKEQQGRRIILGIAVDDQLHPTRKTRRKLRAAKHQNNINQIQGLTEFCKLKPPKNKEYNVLDSDCIEECKVLAKRYKLGSISADKIPDKGLDEKLDNVIITGDPVMMLGMSLYTTNWTSCHSLKNGVRKRGCVYWMHLSGTRIGYIKSNKKQSFFGVERSLMKARCLIHTMRNGEVYHDRCYGEEAARKELAEILKQNGIKHISTAPKNLKVKGHAPARWKAWFDSLKSSIGTAKDGNWKGIKVRYVHT